MSFDQLIYETKIAIMDLYDDTKYAIEIDCQEVLNKLRDQNKDTKEVLSQFEGLLKQNNNIYEQTMLRFNAYIENVEEEYLASKTKEDLIKSHVHSTLYLVKKDLQETSEDGVGVLFHCNWFLDINQANFIRACRFKKKLKKDIRVSLNEVNFDPPPFFFLIYLFFI